MTEQGAAADNACREWSAGRRKAPRKGLAPRDPHRPQSRLGSRKLGAKGRPIARLAWGADRKAPGASRRSIPLVEGKRKTGMKGQPRARKQTAGAMTHASMGTSALRHRRLEIGVDLVEEAG